MLLKLVNNTFWSRLMEVANLSVNLRSPFAAIDRHPVTVAPSTSLGDAIALMRRRRTHSPPHSNETVKTSISCVLVVDKNQLVGLLSQGDVLNLAAEYGWQEMKVTEAMTRNLIVLKESEFTDTITAFKLFCQYSIDCLPIVDERTGSARRFSQRPFPQSHKSAARQSRCKTTAPPAD